MYFDNAGWPNTMWASGVRLRTLKALSKKRPLLGLLICRDMCMHFDFFEFFFVSLFWSLAHVHCPLGFCFSYKRCFSYSVWIFFIQSILFYKIQSMYFVHTLWEILKKKILAGWSFSVYCRWLGFFSFSFDFCLWDFISLATLDRW